MSMSPEEAITYIENCGWSTTRLGLERTRELLQKLGNPQKKLKFIHVAGSNGKGSTCAMLDAILRAAGYRVGIYISPYIQEFCERMQVNGENIPGETLARITERVAAVADAMEDHPSQFELVTAIGMLYFIEAECDIVVLEVGMGGALDSTNVIDAPEAAVITNIGLEHTEYLGNTLEEIAATKAGIIKTGCSAVCYDGAPEVTEVVKSVCREKNVPLRCVDFSRLTPISETLQGQKILWDGKPLHLALLGEHQLHNTATVLETVEALRERGWSIPDAAVADGLASVKWPARLEVLGDAPLFILDGGHNPQCAEALAVSLKKLLPGRKAVFLLGVLADKDYPKIMETVMPLAQEFICLTPLSDRALSAEGLADYLTGCGAKAHACDGIADGIRMSVEAAGKDGVVVAFGSLYLAGAVRMTYQQLFAKNEASEAKMEYFTLTVRRGEENAQIQASPEESLLSALRNAGYTEPDAPCGGNGTCGKCLVTVAGKVRALAGGEPFTVQNVQILACRHAAVSDCVVKLQAKEKMHVMTTGAGTISGGGEGLGFAVDIGTTTVAAFLYDLTTGARLGAKGGRNAQRAYGADVISRITCCSEGKLPAMRDAIRRQLAEKAAELCAENGREVGEIKRIVIAANTVMEHLFAGLDPTNIGVAPFTPESLFGDTWRSKDCLPELDTDAEVYICPCVAGYVGGDITAGLWSSDADSAEGLWLYIDIGTNGEMALGNKDGYMSCATAAGPAFEGAEIACGMDGSAGAIDKVTAVDGDIEVHVIGDVKAVGVCGSGLIDAVSALLTVGAITEAGRMLPPEEVPEKLRSRVFRREDGSMAFELKDGVYIAAQDIREVQLAKSAIRAGAETLLQKQGKRAEDITSLVIAGGFGSFMDKMSALHIGLLPQVDPEKIIHVGNAAGAGAALALTAQGEAELAEFNKKCSYLELSSSPEFMENYVEYMAFGD